MLRVFFACCLLVVCVGTVEAQSTVAWTSSTSYVVFDGTPQANIIGSGVVPSGSTAVALGKPQIEMGALVTGKAVSQGVAATDSRIGATLKSIGSAIAGDMASASVCSGGGIWGFIGCTALNAVVSAAVFLGVDQLWNWLFGSNKVSASSAGSPQWDDQFGSVPGEFASPQAVCAYMTAHNYSPGGTWSAVEYDTFGDYECVSSNGGNPVGLLNSGTPGNSYGPSTVANAVSLMPSTELTQPANPGTTADMINAAWQQASAGSGFQGVPYDPSNPVTASDVTSWEAGNPSFAPTLGDDLGSGSGVGAQGNGAPSTSVGYIPSSGVASDGTGPSGTTGTGTTGTGTGGTGTTGTGTGGTGTTGSDTADLCAEDPTAVACATMGTAPTAGSLPASSTSVSLTAFSVGPASGTCPAPVVVDLFGGSMTFDLSPVCRLATLVEPVILAVCGLVAAMIVIGGLKV